MHVFSTELPTGFLTAPILSRIDRRRYTEYVHKRTSDIWKTRADFEPYYELLQKAAAIDWFIGSHPGKMAPANLCIDVLAYKERAVKAAHKGVAAVSHAVWSIMSEKNEQVAEVHRRLGI